MVVNLIIMTNSRSIPVVFMMLCKIITNVLRFVLILNLHSTFEHWLWLLCTVRYSWLYALGNINYYMYEWLIRLTSVHMLVKYSIHLQLSYFSFKEHKEIPTILLHFSIHIETKREFFLFILLFDSVYLVDPASSHTLVLKIKPCMSKCFDCLTLDCGRLIITVIV